MKKRHRKKLLDKLGDETRRITWRERDWLRRNAQVIFRPNPEQWEQFKAALDRLPQDKPRLRKLMETLSTLETSNEGLSNDI